MATAIPDVAVEAASEAGRYDSARSMLAGKMPNLVKGAGYAVPGGNRPLTDPDETFRRGLEAEIELRKAVKAGISNPAGVVKGLSPSFSDQFGLFMAAAGAPQFAGMHQLVEQVQQALADLGKNVTLTSPLSSGFVPFDLVSPSRLIYPTYSPLRNKLPRVPGQGTSRRAKVITGISGSQTGASGGRFKRISIPEMVQAGGNFSNWPLNLPGSGSQDAVDLNVPYQFQGLSESLSWLAQFSGQGFEDISALANLILLQEFMLSEEAQILCGRTQALAAPSAPTVTAQAAGTGQTGFTGSITAWVRVTAATLLGETASVVAGGSVAVTAGQVIKVTVPIVPGATHYNVYLGTGASDPGAGASYFAGTIGSGGVGYIQGPSAPSSGPTAPTSDTSSSAQDYDGLIAILAGQSTTHPAGWQAGYYNPAVGGPLHLSVLNTALQQLWDGPGAYRADPAELILEGSDAVNLANDIVNAPSGTQAYRLFVEQDDVAGVRAGAAVSEVQNPITRNVVRVLVHPWLPQGNAMLMSYTLPFAWSNVSNVFEMTMVQDYLSISWPVIDATFRYSMFAYGALVAYAPQYCSLLQGITTS